MNQSFSLTKTKKKSTKIDFVFFSYDELNIIGVLNNKVYVVGHYWPDEEKDRVNCLLSFDKSLFKDTLDLWLKDKEEYCERYNHFCGAMGSIIVKSFDITDEELEYNDEILRVISVESIENTCDMEHG